MIYLLNQPIIIYSISNLYKKLTIVLLYHRPYRIIFDRTGINFLKDSKKKL